MGNFGNSVNKISQTIYLDKRLCYKANPSANEGLILIITYTLYILYIKNTLTISHKNRASTFNYKQINAVREPISIVEFRKLL